jgi:hypothetical protein
MDFNTADNAHLKDRQSLVLAAQAASSLLDTEAALALASRRSRRRALEGRG